MRFVSGSNRIHRVATLTDGATVTPNFFESDICNVTIAGNRTVGEPTGDGEPYDGQRLTLRVTQDGTGGRTLLWNAAFSFSGGVAPTLSTTAGATDVIEFQYRLATDKWECLEARIANQSAQVLFMGQATAVQTLTSGNAWTNVLLGGESVDTHSGHSTSSNTDRYTIPVTGNYYISYMAFFTSGLSSGVKAVQLTKNGSTLAGTSRWGWYEGDFLTPLGEVVVPLVAGDAIRMQANGVQGGLQQLFGQATDGSVLIIKSLFV